MLEKSKIPGRLLEAHELTVSGYPAAFKASDRAEIEKCDAQWAVIEAKTKKYVAVLGGTWIDPKCAAAGGKTQPRGR